MKVKSYIIKIELKGSDPLVWRRVIIPAGATFNRLHDIIQRVSNFRSGYPFGDYHLFEFDLADENMIVTNDDEQYLEHKGYKENKKMFEKRLKEIPPEMLEFEKRYQERLEIPVRKPNRLKIDEYLEKNKTIRYAYDFGDNWHFTVKLEQTVEDYHFGFPTLLDGAETAPPEDVGGLHGFYEFLEVYNDPKHPEHKETKAWAESLFFKEYDPDRINNELKALKYKKTQWDKINHDNHRIIEDKYRKK